MGYISHPMKFGEWLGTQMERQELPRRELARRMAAGHPKGVTPATIETYRRAIRRYLEGQQVPNDGTRYAIADALGVDRDQLPADEDEEEDLQLALLLRACRVKSRRNTLPPRLEEWLRWGIRNGVFSEDDRKEMAA